MINLNKIKIEKFLETKHFLTDNLFVCLFGFSMIELKLSLLGIIKQNHF